MRHALKMIAAGFVVVVVACGGGGEATGTGTDTGTGGPTTGGATAPTEAPATEPMATTGGTLATSLDPTNAFTDSSQLTEAPAETTGELPPPNMCEASGLCLDPGGCVECSVVNDCADEFAACLAVPGDECQKYSSCTSACAGDAACVQSCGVMFPNGYDPSWAVFDCSVCDVCPTSCNPLAPYCVNGGGGPGKTDTCDELADCATCSACSVLKGCNDEVNACLADPQCQPYQDCINACSEGDIDCLKLCGDIYPSGYIRAWAAFDCATCVECPVTCAAAQPYCQAGGGGPNVECLSNGDCVEIYDSLPYCVGAKCVECLDAIDCFDPAFPNCLGNFCV